MLISDVMTPCPYKISSEKTLEEALKVLDLRDIRHLPVISGDEVIGVVSKRDIEVGKFVCETTKFCPTIGDICITEPYVVGVDTLVQEVARQMAEKKTDCALVVDDEGNFVGIFTTTDACRVLTLLLDNE